MEVACHMASTSQNSIHNGMHKNRKHNFITFRGCPGSHHASSSCSAVQHMPPRALTSTKHAN
eukprot:2193091-Amphidinium_carterae.1